MVPLTVAAPRAACPRSPRTGACTRVRVGSVAAACTAVSLDDTPEPALSQDKARAQELPDGGKEGNRTSSRATVLGMWILEQRWV